MTGAAPPAPAGGDAPTDSPASLLRRSAALAYEALLLVAIVWLVGLVSVALTSPKAGTSDSLTVQPPFARALFALAVFAVVGAFYVWSWTGGRRTLPMKTWRLRLAGSDGRPVEVKTAIVRYLAAWIGPLAALAGYAALSPARFAVHAGWLAALNYAWALVDRDRQFLHDRIAGTRITFREPAARKPPPGAPETPAGGPVDS